MTKVQYVVSIEIAVFDTSKEANSFASMIENRSARDIRIDEEET